MKSVITIEIESMDPEAPINEFLHALETLLTWQWDNVVIRSKTED